MSKSAITVNGFELELYADKIERFKEQYREKFGQEIDLTDEAIAGMLVAIDAANVQDTDLVAQAIAASLDPDQASGVFLDFLCSFSGTSRLPAVSTQVFCSCRGINGTQILIGSTGKQVSQSAGNFIFNLAADALIDFGNAIEGFVSVLTVANSTAYTITIDTVDFTYTSDSDATEQEILTGLINAINAGALDVTAEQDGTSIRFYSDDFTTAFAFSLGTTNLQIEKGGSRVEFTAQIAGPTVVTTTSPIDTIVTPVSGWVEVINLVPGTTGRYAESDDELRVRRDENVQSTKSGTEQGLENAIYAGVDGVLTASVYSNRTDVTDADGIPPHRFLSIVQGGSDQDIVDAIHPASPAGILSHGNTSGTHIDNKGNPQTVYFSRPENLYVWINISIEVDSNYPSNGDGLVTENLVTRGTELAQIGVDGRLQDLYCSVLEVDGVNKINSLKAAAQTALSPAPAPGAYSDNNIPVALEEILIYAIDRIVVATT